MNLKITTSTIHICFAIAASSFLVVGGSAIAQDTRPNSKSAKQSEADLQRERIEQANKRIFASIKEMQAAQEKREKEVIDLRDKERAAQLEKFHKEREQQEAAEKAEKAKSKKHHNEDEPSKK
jgi:hypothetical protein